MNLAVAEHQQRDLRYHHMTYGLLTQSFRDWLRGGVWVLIRCDVCDTSIGDFMSMDRLGAARAIDMTTPKAMTFFEEHHEHDPDPNDVTR